MGGHKLSFPEWRDRVEANIARGLPEISPMSGFRNVPICVCASGPSLRDHIGALKRMQKRGAAVMAVNRAYEFIVRNGVIPDYFVLFDPDEAMADVVAPRCERTIHLIASQAHPKVFDALQDRKVAIWHALTAGFNVTREGDRPERESDALFSVFGTRHLMAMGAHVGMHAMALATFFGHFDLHMFGMDGSRRKAGAHSVKQARNEEVFEIAYEGRSYLMDPPLMVQADWFEKVIKIQKDKFNLTFHGHGLLAAIWKKETHGKSDKRIDLPQGHAIREWRVPREEGRIVV